MKLARALLALALCAVTLPVIALLVVAMAPFAAVAALVRGWMRLRYGNPKPWDSAIDFNPKMGWKPKASFDGYLSFAQGVFHARTDSEGWAGGTALADADVAVFGDSYAYGYGVDAKELFSEVAGGLRIKPIGCAGYNMVQEFLWMREMAPRLRDKTVVWFVYVGNDLYDNLLPNLYQYRIPFVRQSREDGDWEIANNHVRRESWPFSYEHHSRSEEKFQTVFRPGAASDRAYSACRYLIEQGRDTVEKAGGRLVVMTIPWVIQLGDARWAEACAQHGAEQDFERWLPDRRIAACCRELGVLLIEGRDWVSERHHIPREGHWNPLGHRRAAQALIQAHRTAQLEANRPPAVAPTPAGARPLVSIGVPVRNGEGSLHECLDSLLNQTWRDFEIIVCDNASTDATERIVRQYAERDGRIRYFRNERNIGLTGNFRRALELARGDYFLWASADDYRPPEAIETLVNALERNPSAVMAHGPAIHEGRCGGKSVSYSNDADLLVDDPAARVRNYVRDTSSNTMVYGLYRRGVLQQAVFGDVLSQDFLLCLQVCLLGPVEWTPVPILLYRERKPVPQSHRMYLLQPLSLANFLDVGAAWKRKCWTVLFVGITYLCKLEGLAPRQRLRGALAYAHSFAWMYAGRMGRELVFQAFQPITIACWQVWRLSHRSPLTFRVARRLKARLT